VVAIVAKTLNIIAVLAISGVLLFAFYWQLVRGELPCPLCLVQRLGLIGAGLGFVLNVRFGSSESHYGVVIVSALVGGAAAVRQILLHIVPDTGSYGSAFYGWHFYTWALVVFAAILALAGLLLFIEAQFVEGTHDLRPSMLAQGVGWLFVAIALASAVSTLLECGFGACPDNPTEYELLRK
jgi:disulfide bond formation protein DsbB